MGPPEPHPLRDPNIVYCKTCYLFSIFYTPGNLQKNVMQNHLGRWVTILYSVHIHYVQCTRYPVVGVLDEPYSANHAQRSSQTGPPGYFQTM
jgi:hypothetical protein